MSLLENLRQDYDKVVVYSSFYPVYCGMRCAPLCYDIYGSSYTWIEIPFYKIEEVVKSRELAREVAQIYKMFNERIQVCSSCFSGVNFLICVSYSEFIKKIAELFNVEVNYVSCQEPPFNLDAENVLHVGDFLNELVATIVNEWYPKYEELRDALPKLEFDREYLDVVVLEMFENLERKLFN